MAPGTTDLRPTTTITFKTGPAPKVRAAGPITRAARRYARFAHLPYDGRPATGGLAAWAAGARPLTASVVVELPADRVSERQAARLAYAIDRLAGVRSAAAGQEKRLHYIAHGIDPRESRY